jgi:hypothetical protein
VCGAILVPLFDSTPLSGVRCPSNTKRPRDRANGPGAWPKERDLHGHTHPIQ